MQAPVHTPWHRTGCYCRYPPAPLLEHPQAHDLLRASVQATDFIFSVGNEIQSYTNNCVCFPYRFQSGIASYWKSEILIKFSSPLIFSAIGCKFFSWMGGANLNTWASSVFQMIPVNQIKTGGNRYLYTYEQQFLNRIFVAMKEKNKQAVLKLSLHYELNLLLYPQQIYSCFEGCWWFFFKSTHPLSRLKG